MGKIMLEYIHTLWLLNQTLNRMEAESSWVYQCLKDIHIEHINIDLSELAAQGIY